MQKGQIDASQLDIKEQVVDIRRVTKVVKAAETFVLLPSL
jgi:small subunit ribosomal protein S5